MTYNKEKTSLEKSITELKDKISGLTKDIFEKDNIIQTIKKENVSKQNLYEDTINILNSEREQFNQWKENITKENELNSSSQS
ncbi:hypothetical protein H8356DRAFT_921875, partial [Neocallimastix lanati (nom. inval.)]